jgi:hypothetical protein
VRLVVQVEAVADQFIEIDLGVKVGASATLGASAAVVPAVWTAIRATIRPSAILAALALTRLALPGSLTLAATGTALRRRAAAIEAILALLARFAFGTSTAGACRTAFGSSGRRGLNLGFRSARWSSLLNKVG